MNVKLLADLWLAGFILYPGVPNTTHVTQETDISYGLFKSKFQENLDRLTRDRLRYGMGSSIHSSIVGLVLVFSGKDPVTGCRDYVDAFATAFSPQKNKEAWEKVGAAPLTMVCLKSDMVSHYREEDPKRQLYQSIDERNKQACAQLQNLGLDGQKLRLHLKVGKAPKRKTAGGVTARLLEERYKQLAKASWREILCNWW